jgi:hypothetical protein
VDIIKDSAFDGANNVFISMCKRMRLDGNDWTGHIWVFVSYIRPPSASYCSLRIPWWILVNSEETLHTQGFPESSVLRAVDIIKGSAFDGANNVFISMCKRMRLDGKGKINHKPSIQIGDMQKLYTWWILVNSEETLHTQGFPESSVLSWKSFGDMLRKFSCPRLQKYSTVSQNTLYSNPVGVSMKS